MHNNFTMHLLSQRNEIKFKVNRLLLIFKQDSITVVLFNKCFRKRLADVAKIEKILKIVCFDNATKSADSYLYGYKLLAVAQVH